MREENQSSTREFILLGVTGQQEQEDFFILLLFIYPFKVAGNLLIILAILSDSRLHNPMYFLLANLSLVDIFFSSVTITKMLANHLLGSKTFSTCGSCLTVVSLYYGTVMGMYFQPLASYILKDAVIAVMYMTVTPMLNPFIYSLGNRDMKAALKKLFHSRSSS
ncbi:Olfactory receptor 1A1 [Sciurus carolinensis]|uniref:Olfactory receptor 1A1 n=1 Tax=Sciurus carolinensis TaxID=30640 RepID=A0AA41SW16_SCICA|nr:Olfactory receptor 1A1 [Sciurus carolinensis]